MIRRPPRSTLFPTRRSSDLWSCRPARLRTSRPGWHRWNPRRLRSEEHTSELQSQSNLVCRLLLEKKNTKPPDAATQTNPESASIAPLNQPAMTPFHDHLPPN